MVVRAAQQGRDGSKQAEASPSPGAKAYPYNAGIGERQQKATIEHIFTALESADSDVSTSGSRSISSWDGSGSNLQVGLVDPGRNTPLA
jgi:hypothetical protein